MRIDHVAAWTRDLERLRDFYETYFGGLSGARFEDPRYEYASYTLSFDGGTRLELMSMPSVPRSANDPLLQFTGLVHLAFATGSEERVEELTARLLSDGYRVVEAPHRTADGFFESCVLDPDGNRIEVTV